MSTSDLSTVPYIICCIGVFSWCYMSMNRSIVSNLHDIGLGSHTDGHIRERASGKGQCHSILSHNQYFVEFGISLYNLPL